MIGLDQSVDNILIFFDADFSSASVTVNYKFLETIYRILSQLVVIISNSHLNAKQLQQVAGPGFNPKTFLSKLYCSKRY